MLSNSTELSIWVLVGFTAILTIFFNLYILLMSLHGYRQNGHWLPCETIISALSLTNILHQIISYIWMTMEELDRKCMLQEQSFSIILVIVFSLKFSIIWITAFLTFFYSTKLVIEPIHCYTKIQEAFLKHVGTVVIAIPVCGFITCMPLVTVLAPLNKTIENEFCSSIIPVGLNGTIYVIYYFLISDVIPGLLMLKSSISISVHLAIHLHHMKTSNNGFHTPKLGSEMRVIHMNLGLVVVFLCFLLVDLYVYYMSIAKMENVMMLSILFSSIYTAASSLLLIYGKKTFWKGLLHLHNLFIDEYPCLECLKVPENKVKEKTTPGH
ncbi:uncharacterized protein LOC125718591 [Brienomyrus brachyistius]|uniref:uncharacterized protein LOC125718591 n=1 Tax=Brienomyrus brachyistius TaxID=42636 RepID=UPI0020B1FE36|nr:uncharacterized protein LOC125718591 [Brienomyrus brachyistius]